MQFWCHKGAGTKMQICLVWTPLEEDILSLSNRPRFRTGGITNNLNLGLV